MIIPNYGRYCTNYKANGKTYFDNACFSAFFNSEIPLKVEYELYIAIDPDFGNVCHRNHSLLFSLEEIETHLRELKKVIKGFTYDLSTRKLSLIEDKNAINCYVIHFTICDCKLAHKYALTWIRYLYEYPYNIILKEAYRLKNYNLRFKRINISNLYMACSFAFPSMPGTGHSVNASGYFISQNDLITQIHSVKQLNDIYRPVSWGDYNKGIQIEADHKTQHYYEYWEDEENFKKRVENYKKSIRFLKIRKNE